MKTYAIQASDSIGIVYCVGYVTAYDECEAGIKARDIHTAAWATPVDFSGEADAISRLIDDANRETISRIRRSSMYSIGGPSHQRFPEHDLEPVLVEVEPKACCVDGVVPGTETEDTYGTPCPEGCDLDLDEIRRRRAS